MPKLDYCFSCYHSSDLPVVRAWKLKLYTQDAAVVVYVTRPQSRFNVPVKQCFSEDSGRKSCANGYQALVSDLYGDMGSLFDLPLDRCAYFIASPDSLG